jgi:hypothetical protein
MDQGYCISAQSIQTSLLKHSHDSVAFGHTLHMEK